MDETTPSSRSQLTPDSGETPLNYYRTAVTGAPPPGAPPPPVAVLLTALPPERPMPAQAATPEPAHGAVTVLLLGIDERPNQEGEPTRSDAMMIVRADFDNGTMHLLSLPRDMWVALPLESRGITQGQIASMVISLGLPCRCPSSPGPGDRWPVSRPPPLEGGPGGS